MLERREVAKAIAARKKHVFIDSDSYDVFMDESLQSARNAKRIID